MNDLNIRQEMEDVKIEKQETSFVVQSYRAEDGFVRKKAVNNARDVIKQAVDETHGDMPLRLKAKYEALNELVGEIIAEENGIIENGR